MKEKFLNFLIRRYLLLIFFPVLERKLMIIFLFWTHYSIMTVTSLLYKFYLKLFGKDYVVAYYSQPVGSLTLLCGPSPWPKALPWPALKGYNKVVLAVVHWPIQLESVQFSLFPLSSCRLLPWASFSGLLLAYSHFLSCLAPVCPQFLQKIIFPGQNIWLPLSIFILLLLSA